MFELDSYWGFTVAGITLFSCLCDLAYRSYTGKKNAYRYIIFTQDVLCVLLFGSQWVYVVHSGQWFYMFFRLGLPQTFRLRLHTFTLHWLIRVLELFTLTPNPLPLLTNVRWWLFAFDAGNACFGVTTFLPATGLLFMAVEMALINVVCFGHAFVWTNTWVHGSNWLRLPFAVVWLHQLVRCVKMWFTKKRLKPKKWV
jgi:hypothetical protein